MRALRSRALLLALLLIAAFASAAERIPAGHITDLQPTVILISLDGFRPDYLGVNTPNLNSLAEHGVRAKWMIPSFPTKTFPNHYTIVTGLYPAHHGIVSNSFWDPNFNAKFSMSNRDEVKDARWWGGEPIWVTAEKQGLRTAPVFWPGSEAAIEGVRPAYYEPFDDRRSAEERVEKLLSLLDLPGSERPRFLTLYLSNVDHAGHDFGPGTSQVEEAVAQVDSAIGKLLNGLRERAIDDQVNIIVVSDHGMAPTSRKKVDILDDYVDPKTVEVIDYGPVVSLRARDGNNAALFAKLQHIRHVHSYMANDLPERWHYSGSPRIMPILLVCDDGWLVESREYVQKHADFERGGNHGYDNHDKSMRATFIAEGPAFLQGEVLQPFPNVDVYSLMAYLLNVRPAKNDGTLDVFKPVLVKRVEPHRTERAPWRKELDEDVWLQGAGATEIAANRAAILP